MSIHKAYGQLKTKQKLQHQIAPQEKGKSTIINKTSSKTDAVSSDSANGLHHEQQNEFAESKKESTVTPLLNDEISPIKPNEDLTDRNKEMFVSHVPMSFEDLQKDMDTVSQITKKEGNIFFEVLVDLGTQEIKIEFCGPTQQKDVTMISTGKGILREAE